MGGSKLSLSEEPCLFEYFIFLVKIKGSLNTSSINEAQKLWDGLCTVFNFKNKGPQLLEAIQESNKKIYFDKRIKRIITEII